MVMRASIFEIEIRCRLNFGDFSQRISRKFELEDLVIFLRILVMVPITMDSEEDDGFIRTISDNDEANPFAEEEEEDPILEAPPKLRRKTRSASEPAMGFTNLAMLRLMERSRRQRKTRSERASMNP